jgi:H(+)-transporting ATP synthase subunit D
MIHRGRTPPTRHALLRVKHRATRVSTAIDLLTRKRQALVNELFRTARPVLAAREAIEWQSAVAFGALLRAEADRGSAFLQSISLPLRELEVELRLTDEWGLPGAEIVAHDPIRRAPHERGMTVGASGPAALATAEAFEELTALLLDAASRELLIRRLARALADTSHRVNLLERRVKPDLVADIARIESMLEEREREEQLRHRWLQIGSREKRSSNNATVVIGSS